MIGTETKTQTRQHATATRTHCSGTTHCRCGQQLDLCAHAHCPRCGRSIARL